MNTSSVGKLGEDIACLYIKHLGYTVLDRNFRVPFGEIDIISRSPDTTLIFFEVKTMTSVYRETLVTPSNSFTPEDHVTFSKLQKIKKTALFYCGLNEKLLTRSGFRIDVLTLLIPPPPHSSDLTKLLKNCVVNHYQNV